MSYKLTEGDTQSEAPKKLPYNLREKREKDAAYRTMIRAELADELYQKIVEIVIVKKKYKDRTFRLRIWPNCCKPIHAICLLWLILDLE